MEDLSLLVLSLTGDNWYLIGLGTAVVLAFLVFPVVMLGIWVARDAKAEGRSKKLGFLKGLVFFPLSILEWLGLLLGSLIGPLSFLLFWRAFGLVAGIIALVVAFPIWLLFVSYFGD